MSFLHTPGSRKRTFGGKSFGVIFSTLLCSALSAAAFANEPNTLPSPAAKKHKTYIVQLADKPLIAYEGNITGLAATKPQKNRKLDFSSSPIKHYAAFLAERRNDALAAVPGARKVHDYEVAFNGFAAQMTASQAELLRDRKDVVGIWEDRLMKPQTNSTYSYLGLDNTPGPWLLGATGEDVVIGVIDSGIHPEHPSLEDTRTPKRGNRGRPILYDAVPESFSGAGCDFGNTEFNSDDLPFDCNNKLVKAEAFSSGFLSVNSLADYEFLSARDADGHGTHTATTAAGNFGVEGIMQGEATGTLSGVAPRARVAVYKVCWDAPDPDDSGCFSSDSMAAIDQAVKDGVDVINFSVGGASTTFNGPDDIAFLYAADAGVFVAVSAGNSGPGNETIGTPSGVPWVTSVGATEDNQSFGTGLEVSAPGSLAGIFEGLEGSGPARLADNGTISGTVVSAEPLDGCTPLTNSEAMAGNIALIIRGACAFTDKYNNAAAAGASAIVVFNDGAAPDRMDPITMSADGTSIPGIMIRHPDGMTLAGSGDVSGSLSAEIQVSRDNRIAGFSSRGANAGAPDIIKPDIAAPGVSIVAGISPVGSGETFGALSGTSMASPHIAGVMALLKQAHPEWTPAMARSALMTSARQNMKKSFGETAADPFDIGAGMVQPANAFFPGLVYDAGLYDYYAFLCGAENQPQMMPDSDCEYLEGYGFSTDSSDLNLPSIGIAELVGSQTITRRVTSVAKGTQWYWAEVDAPAGVQVQVSPRILRLKEGETATFEVTFTATAEAAMGEWAFGSLSWSQGLRKVRSPIAVRPVPISAPVSVSAEGTAGSLNIPVVFGYDGSFSAAVNGLAVGAPFPGYVEDGDYTVVIFEIPEGTSLSRIALFDADVGAGDGSDDLDLQVLGPDTSGFPLVGSSGSPTSAEQVDLVNPTPGIYAALVVDYASAAGATPYTLFNFNLQGDAGNTRVDGPASASVGSTGNLYLEWDGLPAGTRALGMLQHQNDSGVIAATEVMINTR
ncbi:S8 family serine peptidase [Microbulbifer sp. CAU 1566]|uniref:S8 family serine peptidase n=1 Tax=Microbulbifer sp. CAU 1566 TaxID=2933269 RepID=UPI002005F567|nr:S8 family serine peptidase [Microbulbifer sp. CAU 1566]MCK7598069.1 S8 family serine peptidase [Microbulbifer sp. CAU 1566]